MAEDFDYDEFLRLAQSAPEPNLVVCRSVEEAQALVAWIEDTFPEDSNG